MYKITDAKLWNRLDVELRAVAMAELRPYTMLRMNAWNDLEQHPGGIAHIYTDSGSMMFHDGNMYRGLSISRNEPHACLQATQCLKYVASDLSRMEKMRYLVGLSDTI